MVAGYELLAGREREKGAASSCSYNDGDSGWKTGHDYSGGHVSSGKNEQDFLTLKKGSGRPD